MVNNSVPGISPDLLVTLELIGIAIVILLLAFLFYRLVSSGQYKLLRTNWHKSSVRLTLLGMLCLLLGIIFLLVSIVVFQSVGKRILIVGTLVCILIAIPLLIGGSLKQF